jgi:integrase
MRLRAEAEQIAVELLPAVCFNVTDMTIIQYIKKFWRPDSPYFREHEKVYKHKLSAYYSKSRLDVIRLHIEPYPPFAHIGIEKLTAGLVRDWMLWAAERGASGSRINRAMQAIRVPLRYAIDRDEAKVDPFGKVRPVREARNITFHSLRHTFISLARLAGIGDLQALAGHKSGAMMERYTHREEVVEIAECRKIIEGFFQTA